VTLNLVETLLSFNIEDVMFSLIFQYLISCNHLLPEVREKLNQPDPQFRAAHKFLSLAPVCCDPPVTPLTPRRGPLVSPRGGSTIPYQYHPLGGLGGGSSSNVQGNPGSHHSLTEVEGIGSTNYDEYLRESRQLIRNTMLDCIQWRHQYDARTLIPARRLQHYPGRTIIQGLKQGFHLDSRRDVFIR
jgi:hypothetical protein